MLFVLAVAVSWLGVHPGDPIGTATQTLGASLMQQPFSGSTIWWFRSKSTAAFVFVEERNGQAMGIGARLSVRSPQETGIQDPYGIALGGAGDQLKHSGRMLTGASISPMHRELYYRESSGDTWIYDIDQSNGTIFSMQLASGERVGSPPPDATPSASDVDGTSAERAYVVKARTENEGVGIEYASLDYIAGCGGRWMMEKQAVMRLWGHAYDRLDLACSRNPEAKKSVFFEITSFYGKS